MRDGQALIDRQNLEFHRAIAARVESDTTLLAAARAVVATWRSGDGGLLAERWSALLIRPPTEIAKLLASDEGDAATWLRSASPFLQVGALTDAERQAIRARVRAEAA
jgi:hypothetical protein